MKKSVSVFVAILLGLSVITGCGSASPSEATEPVEEAASEAGESTEEKAEEPVEESAEAEEEAVEEAAAIDLDLVDTRWKNEDHEIYYFFQADGVLTEEFISISSTTSTVNGTTTSHTSRSKREEKHEWSREGSTIAVDGKFDLELCGENGTYCLTRTNDKYYLTDVDPLADPNEEANAEAAMNAEPYEINNTISTDTIEMTFTEKGVAEDIRISSQEGGFKMTSGPSPESGKKFFYIKGTVKNLNTSAISTNMTGKFTIDGYTFDMNAFTAKTDASPSSSIDPLEEMIIMLYAPVANELADNYSEAILTFGFNDNFERAASIGEASHCYMVSF